MKRAAGHWALFIVCLGLGVASHRLGSVGWSVIMYQAAGLLTLVVASSGLLRHGRVSRPWSYLIAGLSLWIAAALVSDIYLYWELEPSGLEPSDVLYFAGYPCFFFAAAHVIRARGLRLDRETLVDLSVLTIAGVLAVFVFVIQPTIEESGATARAVTDSLYPLGDVVLFATLGLLVFTVTDRPPILRTLLLYCGTVLLLDIAFLVTPLVSDRSTDGVSALYPSAHAILAAMMWRSDADELTNTSPITRRILRPVRLGLLGIGLAVPGLVGLGAPSPSIQIRMAVAVAAATITALVMYRVVTTVRAREGAEDELRRRAAVDPLTGLANRGAFVERLTQASERRDTHGALDALLYVDLDHFKSINDTHGHHVGDRVLTTIADRLRSVVRPGDTVARLGGDEFVVLCENLEDLAVASAVATRIVEVASEPIDIEGTSITISASIGLSSTCGGSRSFDLVDEADSALYRAKERGRSRWDQFDDELRRQNVMRRSLEADLGSAFERGEFKILYQPIVDLATLTTTGFESFLRWDHPTLGNLAPASFLALADESGHLIEIGRWSIEQGCRQLAMWRAETPQGRAVDLHINLTGREITAPDFLQALEEIVLRTGVPTDCLVLELKEVALVNDADQLVDVLQSLNRLGVRVAIDDFGAGYASLAVLRRLPIGVVKVVPSLLAELHINDPDTAVISAVVALARALGHEAVPVGVDRSSQVQVLRDLGCERAQGFLFAGPMSAEEAGAHLRAGRDRVSPERDRSAGVGTEMA